MSLGTFSHDWPIGAYMRPQKFLLHAVHSCLVHMGFDGTASHTALEFTDVDVSGGYAIAWDEDPV